MNTVVIEHMRLEDIPDVSAIMVDAFNNSPVKEHWTEEASTQHLKEDFNAKYSFVAKEHGTVIGALTGSTFTSDKGTMYYIDTLVVRLDKRGNGVGEMLMDKAIELAKQQKLSGLELDANSKLQSHAWYKRLGFKESGWVDMVKTLV